MTTQAVPRHRTAIARNSLSRPFATALADELIDRRHSIFDYGCGRGDDLSRMSLLGYQIDGWDPNHRPNTELRSAQIVNLGYVVNVIENPSERAATLQHAWDLAQRLLIVSSRLTWEARHLEGRRPLSDGIQTRTGTFQKLYEQNELARWIEETIGVQPHAAAPGIFYVFRDPVDAQSYVASRVYTYRPRVQIDPHRLYEANQETVEPLFAFMRKHARSPRRGELDTADAARISDALGSVGRAQQLIRRVTTGEYWDQVATQRRWELLVYVALSRFTRRPRFSELGRTLGSDIRFLFGDYKSACTQANRLLLACGDPAMVLVTARSSKVGKQTPSALYVHRDALAELPPLLQVYEGCARVLAGTVPSANMVKLSVREPQVSFLSYPRFEKDAHPTLSSSVIVNLRKLSVEWRDYRDSENPPILHRKEEFISTDDPRRNLYSKLTDAELRAGLYEFPERIGTAQGWQQTLTRAGVIVRGHRLRAIIPRRHISSPDPG
ncbi:SAM-dependent methyltransferase [Mycolicibacterium porcinum]|uniref:DNA phosphorothioation-associated putative methyltransferase n=1 Tax=Mycolicibacterium porcinum TaxID=39693 RepID=UPI00080B6FBD|nr:DNA phosphorothioation-associated putative methyltransferase [Mycolicibacterium porcinum]OCB14093.1 SAM-dependent methyltransferase [Mycolicibacterium porcinum]